jgi:hypothetical protein
VRSSSIIKQSFVVSNGDRRSKWQWQAKKIDDELINEALNYYYQDHLVVVVDELLERALVGGPDAAVHVRARRRADVADVRPPQRLDDGVELGGVAHVEAAQEDAAVGHHLALHPLPVRLERLHQRLAAAALGAVVGGCQDQRHLLAIDGLLPLALAHAEEVGRLHCYSLYTSTSISISIFFLGCARW